MPISNPRRWLPWALFWTAALTVGWWFFSPDYEQALGRILAPVWPDGAFVFHRDHTFGIGLGDPATFSGPLLEFLGHNFGFGLVAFGAAVLATPGRGFLARAAALTVGWAFLFITHAGIILGGALSYRSLASNGSPSAGVELFSTPSTPSLSAILIALPLAMAVGWVILSTGLASPEVHESRRQRRRRSQAERRTPTRKATA